MSNKELLSGYTVLNMEQQEEFLKEKQDFEKQKILHKEYEALKKEILNRMTS